MSRVAYPFKICGWFELRSAIKGILFPFMTLSKRFVRKYAWNMKINFDVDNPFEEALSQRGRIIHNMEKARSKICCFFKKKWRQTFTFTALHSTDKFLNEQQILGLKNGKRKIVKFLHKNIRESPLKPTLWDTRIVGTKVDFIIKIRVYFWAAIFILRYVSYTNDIFIMPFQREKFAASQDINYRVSWFFCICLTVWSREKLLNSSRAKFCFVSSMAGYNS